MKINYFNNEKHITGTFDMFSAKKCMKETGDKYSGSFNWSNGKKLLHHILWNNSANKDLPNKVNVNQQVLESPVLFFENGVLKVGTEQETKKLYFDLEKKYNDWMEKFGKYDSNRNKSSPVNFGVAQINLKWPEEKERIISYFQSLAETLKQAGAEPLFMKIHINEKGQPHAHIGFDNTHKTKDNKEKLGRGKTEISKTGQILRLGKFEKPILVNLRKDINLNAKKWADKNNVKFRARATTPQPKEKSVNQLKEEYKLQELEHMEQKNKSFISSEYLGNLVQDIEIQKSELEAKEQELNRIIKDYEQLEGVNLKTLDSTLKENRALKDYKQKYDDLLPVANKSINKLFNLVEYLQRFENKKFDNVPDLDLTKWKQDFNKDHIKAVERLISQVDYLTGQKSYIPTKNKDYEPVKQPEPVKSKTLEKQKTPDLSRGMGKHR